MLEFSTSADEQRTQFVQRQEAKSGECDVFYADVIWTAEFASQKWIFDMTPYVESQQGRPDPGDARHRDLRRARSGACRSRPTRRSSTTAPTRSTRCRQPGRRSTSSASQNDGIVYQGAPYEGLTCDFLELAYAAGGEILSEDGTEAVIDSEENLAALEFMVDGVKDGTAANGVTTYMEEESRRYFESGPRDLHAQLAVRVRARRAEGHRRSRASSTSRRSRSSRAAARRPSSAATTR